MFMNYMDYTDDAGDVHVHDAAGAADAHRARDGTQRVDVGCSLARGRWHRDAEPRADRRDQCGNRLFATPGFMSSRRTRRRGLCIVPRGTRTSRCRDGRGNGSSSHAGRHGDVSSRRARRSLVEQPARWTTTDGDIVVRARGRARASDRRASPDRLVVQDRAERVTARGPADHAHTPGNRWQAQAAPAIQRSRSAIACAFRRDVRPVSARRARAARAAAADLHARSVGLGPHRRRRDGAGALREARAGADRIAVRDQQRRRARAAHGRAARSRRSAPAAVERAVADAGQRPLPPADGLRRLQPDLRGVPAARSAATSPGRSTAPADGPLRLVVRPFGFEAPTPATAARPATCRSATSAPATRPPASRSRAA